MTNVVVIKQNAAGQEVWRYPGRILYRRADAVLLEAHFNRFEVPFHGVTLREGDRFLEAYYSNCWYNIYEIHDREDDHLKGWYCNVTYPAQIEDGQIIYRDLALDLLVYPDGRQLVLDEDEFAELELSEADQQQARRALGELQALFREPVSFRPEEWEDGGGEGAQAA